jgi:hypothetical protein
VQVIFAVVDGQRVLMTVEGEAALCDAIPITADDRAEVRIAFQIRIEVIEAENNIVTLPFTVRHFERCDNAAVVGDLNFSSAAIRQSIEINVLSVRCLAKAFLCYFGLTARAKVQPQDHRAANHPQPKYFHYVHEMPPPLATFRYPKAFAPGDDPEIIAG